jgi:hypothetical protein
MFFANYQPQKTPSIQSSQKYQILHPKYLTIKIKYFNYHIPIRLDIIQKKKKERENNNVGKDIHKLELFVVGM